jgi:hypothetical protein
MQVDSHIVIPYVSIKPGFITTYEQVENRRPRTEAQRLNELNLRETATEGEISEKAERRIKTAIDWLLFMALPKKVKAPKTGKQFTFKINFITLTLAAPQLHSDNDIKKSLLNQFLTEAREQWGVQNYVWRAEAQRNGNIHFHIVTDVFCPWWQVKRTWNRIQEKLGYITAFQAKHGHRDPNSTDIHSVARIKNISAYLAKYCTKNSPNRKITGKLWGLSYTLSRAKSAIDMRYSDIENELSRMFIKFSNKIKTKEYFQCLYVHVKEWAGKEFPVMTKLFNSYVQQLREMRPPPKIHPSQFA